MVDISTKKEFNILTEVGNKTFETLSKNLYSTDFSVFEELISNSIDAKAKKVNIYIEKNKIVVEDDGEGLDEMELKTFFSIGISKKNDRKEYEKNIGQFGLGTFSIRRIAKKYKIETFKDNKGFEGIFDFEKYEKLENLNQVMIPIKSIEKNDKNENGTRIIMENLIRDFEEKDIIELQKRISFSLPLEKIKVYINNNFTYGLDYEKTLRNAGGVKNIKNSFEFIDKNTSIKIRLEKNEINFKYDFVNKKLFISDYEIEFKHKTSRNLTKELLEILKKEDINRELKFLTGKIVYSENPIIENNEFNYLYGLKIKTLGRIISYDINYIRYRNVSGKGYWDTRICGFVNCDSLKKLINISRATINDDNELFKVFRYYLEKIYIKITNLVHNSNSKYLGNIKLIENTKNEIFSLEERIKQEGGIVNLNNLKEDLDFLINLKKELEEKLIFLIKEREKRERTDSIIEFNKKFLNSVEILSKFLENKFSYNMSKNYFIPRDDIKNLKKFKDLKNNLNSYRVKKYGNELNEYIIFLGLQIYENKKNGKIELLENSLDTINFYEYYETEEIVNDNFLNENIFAFKDDTNFFLILAEINKFYKKKYFYIVVLLSRKLFELLCLESLKRIFPNNPNKYLWKNGNRYQNFDVLLENLEKYYKENKIIISGKDLEEIFKRVQNFRNEANFITHSKEKLEIDLCEFSKLNIPTIYNDFINKINGE